MSRLRHLAPAGAPIRATDLARWMAAAAGASDPARAFGDRLRRAVGIRHVHATVTGRAGLTILLRALRTLAAEGRNEVVLPAYTCYSVAASVVKAGLTPRIVDISAETLDFDQRHLEDADLSRTLAIVATNLYGLPNDMPFLEAFARQRGVFLVDDAAQALGAAVAGRASGTWGDAGLYSFDKGKNVSAIDGGAIVTSSDAVAAAVAREMADLGPPSRKDDVALVVKAVVYWALLRPWLYWIPQRLPLGLGETRFTTDYPLERASRLQLGLAATMLDRLQEFNTARVSRATALLEGLEPAGAVRPIRPLAGSLPVYLRLPLLAASPLARDETVRALNRAGIGATGSYPTSIADIPELGPTAGAERARFVAERILTLPTHPYVSQADLRHIRSVLSGTHPATARSREADNVTG